eukprot:10872414-Lingulodinium_polyedra.AAC.1
MNWRSTGVRPAGDRQETGVRPAWYRVAPARYLRETGVRLRDSGANAGVIQARDPRATVRRR